MSRFDELFQKLYSSWDDSHFVSDCYDVVDELKQMNQPGIAADYIFRLLEDLPDTDFGLPGPLIAYIEEACEDEFEAKLLASLNRKPVFYTIWMLNRLINSYTGDAKLRLIGIMQRITEREELSTDLQEQAKGYVEFQMKRLNIEESRH